MPVPTNGWINGGWNKKLSQFHLLAEMLGLKKPSISPDELQDLFSKVASAKVFAESVQPFLEAVGKPRNWVIEQLEAIEHKLGLMEPLPFMSLRGWMDPSEFSGVAIWPAGITNWTNLRFEEILKAENAGAKFERVLMLGSSRICNAPADRRHPLIRNIPEGEEPDERELQHRLVHKLDDNSRFIKVTLPKATKEGKPLSLEAQLKYMMNSGEYDKLIGGTLTNIYVPATPNSLYVPLHVRRALGHNNVWFSQAGARLAREMPDYFWPHLQDVLTTPNGIIRLWVELMHAGCITT